MYISLKAFSKSSYLWENTSAFISCWHNKWIYKVVMCFKFLLPSLWPWMNAFHYLWYAAYFSSNFSSDIWSPVSYSACFMSFAHWIPVVLLLGCSGLGLQYQQVPSLVCQWWCIVIVDSNGSGEILFCYTKGALWFVCRKLLLYFNVYCAWGM